MAVRCASLPSQLAGRPGLVETEWLSAAAWEVLSAADVRNHPSGKDVFSLGSAIRHRASASNCILPLICMIS